MKDSHDEFFQVMPIADTIGGSVARENPKGTLDHYDQLASQLWLSPEVGVIANSIFLNVQQGKTAWGSLTGPYGFGKTASTIALWKYASSNGFLAIPPLSCTDFNELAAGIASLASTQVPKIEKQANKLYREVFMNGLNPIVREDAKRYSVPSRKVRQIYQDKFSAGQFTLDTQTGRTVEFLSKLGELASKYSKGLVIILDELQQLLGPLDARTIVRFREFVWGMRTERSHCGIVLALDTLLEARLDRWAADILHRIRENGPALQLTEIYTREFPFWLWEKLTSSNGKSNLSVQPDALSQSVLESLGQLVERPDLANGPRTVVDVFCRAITHYRENNLSYDIPHLVDDVHQGRFRYFGDGATIQSVLTGILSDEWILEDHAREALVKTLAVFPQGCSAQILHEHVSDEKKLEKARSELFGPLLVELSDGIALEPLQQVRRIYTNLEQILSRCWETLPALDALAAQAPDMILRILVPKLFPQGTPATPDWEWLSDDSSAVLTDWHRLCGTFDGDYPQREIALCVTDIKPESWPRDVDACIALVCDINTDPDVSPNAELLEKNGSCLILLQLPILRPLTDQIPADLQRYGKYIHPEPFRPATILTALHDLEAFRGSMFDHSNTADNLYRPEEKAEENRIAAFKNTAVDFVLRELLAGSVEVGLGSPISVRGPELLRSLFTQACRHRFPQYHTLSGTTKWQNILSSYRKAVRSDRLNTAQRQGLEDITMPKQEMYDALFGQMSTAAGDSFIKKLDKFVEVKKNPNSFSIRLAMHPAEDSLMSYLKKFATHQFIPLDAAVEFLRHHGYIQTETEEIVKILIARECIISDSNGSIRYIPNPEIERNHLLKEIAEVMDGLRCFEVSEDIDSISQTTSIANLHKYLQEKQARLESVVKEQIQDLETGVNSLQDLIGAVSAAVICTEWMDSDLSTHLTGIAIKLRKAQENLLKTLRNELERTAQELESSSGPAVVKWAAVQQEKKSRFLNGLQRLQARVKRFDTLVDSLTEWEALNSKLHSTAALCAKIAESEASPTQALTRLVSEFKERFATDLWAPLESSSKFSERLERIQSEVQGLLYSFAQSFNRELGELVGRFRILLPSTLPPVFDVSLKGDLDDGSIYEPFQNLYQWALEGFRTAFSVCQNKKQSGAQWRSPNNRGKNWKKLEAQIEAEIQKADKILDFETVQNIGKTVLLMKRGFASLDGDEDIIGFYIDPGNPPDFDRLAQSFREGKIQIRVQSIT